MFEQLSKLISKPQNSITWGSLVAHNQGACALGTGNTALCMWQSVQPLYIRSVRVNTITYIDNNGVLSDGFRNYINIDNRFGLLQRAVITFFCQAQIPTANRPSILTGTEYLTSNADDKILLNLNEVQMIDRVVGAGQFGIYLDQFIAPGASITPYGSYYTDMYVSVDYALINNNSL